MNRSTITIGTRGSQLALIQTHHIADLLLAAYPDLEVSVKIISTRGDQDPHTALPHVGGKGLFTAELEAALLNGSIDMAVHSAKDLPTSMPQGLKLAAVSQRQDVRDALISREGRSLLKLPPGALIGTSSVRRMAQLLRCRKDLRFCALRGNVDTRLRKVLSDQQCDATILAVAGLTRLNLTDRITEILDFDVMLPAAGQGALAVQARSDDEDTCRLLQTLHHEPTCFQVKCERHIIQLLEGGCQAPIGVVARSENERLLCQAIVVSPDGQHHVTATAEGAAMSFLEIAEEVAGRLRADGALDILRHCRDALPWGQSPRQAYESGNMNGE